MDTLHLPEADSALIPEIKQQLAQFAEHQLGQFRARKEIRQLLLQRAELIDDLLARLWRRADLEGDGLSLIAVGGYGRGELHPHSDIDLLLLSTDPVNETQQQAISAFITLLWDLKLDIGHSVRTFDETIALGREDITVGTNLMESRLLAGDRNLYQRLQNTVFCDSFWPSDAFYLAKRDEQIARHQQGNAFDLEPDIKSGPGSLRDIQNIGWIAKRHFHATVVQQLVAHGFLTQDELAELLECQDFLWRLRFALHQVSGRAENKLLFDYQPQVAEVMGYENGEQLAVEQMMTHFYQTARQITELGEMLLQLFKRVFLSRVHDLEITAIDDHFQRRGHFIEATDDQVFAQPERLLTLFLHIARDPDITGIYAPTLRLLRQTRNTLAQALIDLPQCRQGFMQLLKHPRGISAFSLMHKHGIMGSYLPAWKKIEGQMQFDLFHAYTVDEHTHRLLLNIDRFMDPQYKDEFPLCTVLVNNLEKKGLLVLAAIFHDIAKGRGGDHSLLGSVDAIEFCRQHGMNDHDGRLVAWLVENHLVMSVTAQRRDIHDPDVVSEFAEVVRDETRLAYLYCLTVADICSTNNNLWNNWKGSLLRELYFQTLRTLRSGKAQTVDLEARVLEYQNKARQLLIKEGVDSRMIGALPALWQRFDQDYFLRHAPALIASHAEAVLNHDDDKPLVLFSPHPLSKSTELFIYMPDKANLFATVMQVLDNKSINVHDAQISATNDGYALDTFIIMERDGNPVTSSARIKSIRQHLEKALQGKQAKLRSSRRISRRVKQFNVPTYVSFLPDNQQPYTMMELVALDTPGLLAAVGKVFLRCELILQTAKITTIGERVEDFFVLSTSDGEPLNDEQQQQLRDELTATIAKLIS